MQTIEIAVRVVRTTPKALLVDHGGKEEVWIPRSQISDYCGDSEDTATSIFVPEWLAIEKGLV